MGAVLRDVELRHPAGLLGRNVKPARVGIRVSAVLANSLTAAMALARMVISSAAPWRRSCPGHPSNAGPKGVGSPFITGT